MSEVFNRLKAALADRYAIEREIGAGGMATVFLAKDVKHNRRVALKLLRPELGAVLGVERLLSEIQVTANLQHPNLLPLFDSGEADGQLFYVMPYVEGESLRKRLDREKQLPIDTALHIATAVASALDYAHRQGVIHRDLKPENILIHENEPLVADFGIALAVSNAGGGRVTQTGLSLGTPQYMSPEQATGDRGVDGRADIYSLAAVTYEMLTGEAPHTGTTSQAIIARVLTERPRSVRATRPSVSEHVEWAVGKGLEKLPADRFGSAREFADALRDPVSGRHLARGEAKAVGRGLRVKGVVAVAASMLLGALGWSALYSRPAAPEPATARFDLVLPDSAPLAFRGPAPLGQWQSALALSPDGSLLAYVGQNGASTSLYVREMASGIVRILPSTEGARLPFFSPDSRWIAFLVGDALRKISVEGGTSLLLASSLDIPYGGTWIEDGRVFVSDVQATKPILIPEAGGVADTVRIRGAQQFRRPSPLPGGEWLVGTTPNQLSLLSIRSGEVLGISVGGVKPLDSIRVEEALLSGSQPLYVEPGFLVYLSSSSNQLMALPFDGRARKVLGNPFPVLPGVRKEEQGWAHYAVGSDGTFIYAPGVDARIGTLTLIDSAGHTESLGFPPDRYTTLRLSPDGRRVAVSVPSESGPVTPYILDLASKRMEALPVQKDEVSTAWAWISGGSEIVVARQSLFTRLSQGTVAYSLASGQERRISDSNLGWFASHPTKPVALACGEDCFTAMTVLSLDSGIERDGLADNAPAHISFSPDGNWFAYLGNEIRVSRFPDDGRTYPVPTDVVGAEQPFWTRDGGAIYYRAARQIWKVDFSATGGPDGGPRFGKPRLYLEGPFVRGVNWSQDLSPDGRILLMMGSPEVATSRLGVIANFPSLLAMGARSDR